jgi:hypothetical protein
LRLTNSCCIENRFSGFRGVIFPRLEFRILRRCSDILTGGQTQPFLSGSGLPNDPPVKFTPLSYTYDQQRPSFNLVQNPIIPHTQAVDLLVACQLLNACRIRILSQSVDSSSNPFSDRSIQRSKISFGSQRQSDAQVFLDPIP